MGCFSLRNSVEKLGCHTATSFFMFVNDSVDGADYLNHLCCRKGHTWDKSIFVVSLQWATCGGISSVAHCCPVYECAKVCVVGAWVAVKNFVGLAGNTKERAGGRKKNTAGAQSHIEKKPTTMLSAERHQNVINKSGLGENERAGFENIDPQSQVQSVQDDVEQNGQGCKNCIFRVPQTNLETFLDTLSPCELTKVAKKQRTLGEGVEGEVALYATDQFRFAVKRGLASSTSLEREAQLHWRVTQCQRRTGVDYVVPLLAAYYCDETNTLVTVMPVYSRGTLEDELERVRGKPDADVVLATREKQGVAALEWLHKECRMVHGDTHLGNWFLGDDDVIRLADFGMAMLAERMHTFKQFEIRAQYELLSFRYEVATNASKKLLGAEIYTLEQKIESDPKLMKDVTGADVL